MLKIDTEEMKSLQLAMLIDVADYCEKHNIRYYLCGGTLLGCIRHQGYIPWDDDIDICMPRPDYNRFIRSYGNTIYSVLCWENDHRYISTYAKVTDTRTYLEENSFWGLDIGVNIDVFPVDGLPRDDKTIAKVVRKMKSLWGLVVCATVKDIKKRTVSKKIAIYIMRVFYAIFHVKSKVVEYTIKQAQKYSFNQSEKVATLVWGYGMKEVLSKSTASTYIKSEFEGHMFNIPQNYNEYLSNVYGDFMELPPEEERVYKHDARAFWR